mmetsp:Transcript_28507/g.69374  ORF Transcript_28507/g.69374 Transcript_28507/m.69374 type:complete len:92 (-) Transcript_28507:34-309(-)
METSHEVLQTVPMEVTIRPFYKNRVYIGVLKQGSSSNILKYVQYSKQNKNGWRLTKGGSKFHRNKEESLDIDVGGIPGILLSSWSLRTFML